MTFLENIGKKFGDAAQAVAKKSGELFEVTKFYTLNSSYKTIKKTIIQLEYIYK